MLLSTAILRRGLRAGALAIALIMGASTVSNANETEELPWNHGRLQVSPDGHYLCHSDGTPFFWLADTGWLLPQKLNRSEASYYLQKVKDAGFNVVQVQTVNGVPTVNVYGQYSHINGFDFSGMDRKDVYSYWDHLDYIIDNAATKGVYIAMTCIWGGLVKNGEMNVEEAKSYGKFLADRYKNRPNIIWIIGGDLRGDIKTEVWEALANTIRKEDPNHLMTYHPFGRTSSVEWFHNADWLDFNMFQSGHRAYDQIKGDGDDRGEAALNEDNWRYVEAGRAKRPVKPILDGEPSYEHIPHGLHDPSMPRWGASDVRRYAYWSVFAGACGHTYGHNSIMQMKHDADLSAYGAEKTWTEALNDEGFNDMKHLKKLILTFPYNERIPDQSVIAGENGYRYDRVAATRGKDYMLLYNYTGHAMDVNMKRISGAEKNAWWYDVTDGSLEYIGKFPGGDTVKFLHRDSANNDGSRDRVLIVTDASTNYISPEQAKI